jgi:hypothetical protein
MSSNVQCVAIRAVALQCGGAISESSHTRSAAMKTNVRRCCWAVALTAATALTTVSVAAVDDWASGPALGDVAVSFDNQIVLLDNENPNVTVDTLSETGVIGYGGMVFDAFLNLVATKTAPDGGGELVKFGPLGDPHTKATPNITTQPSPSALAIAADGTIYVASRSLTSGARAVIRRIPPSPGIAKDFNIVADTTDCIGIDLDPDQTTLWVVTGGRTVKKVLNAHQAEADTNTSPFLTLTDNGAACGIRLLAPPDIRESNPPPPLDLVRFVLADGKEVKFIKSRPNSTTPQIAHFNAGSGNKKWFDVAIDPAVTDPNIADVWAVDRGGDNLAKFRLGTGATVFVRSLGLEPKGLAVNGELRAAQTVVVPVTLVPPTLTAPEPTRATFYGPNPEAKFSWLGQTKQGTVTFAIQAFEVTDVGTAGDPDTKGICAPSSNILCRLSNHFSDAVPKIISRGRSAVLREIWRVVPTDDQDILTLRLEYRDLTTRLGGTVCQPNKLPPTTAWLRDPLVDFPGDPPVHDQFSKDVGLAIYGGDDGTLTKLCRTCANDNLLVDRTSPPVKYNLRVINPVSGSTIQVKRSLPISVEVTDPFANCAAVPGLTGLLMFTVTDITTSPGTPKGDTLGFIGTPLTSSGHPFAFSANLYRTNLNIDPQRLPAGRKYRLCPQIPSNALGTDGTAQPQFGEFGAPQANEACVDFNTIK